jgi:dTDP-4-amino-4,6-dideoxygalactose transaminase
MTEKLAVDGGKPVRNKPLPARGLITAEDKAAAIAVFDEAIASGQAFAYDGKHEQAYDKAFAGFMEGGFADGVNSGTNAVYVALGALQLDPFSEVIVPPISDPGGVTPVCLLGCVPVMADAFPESFNTSAEQIEKVITERTSAIVVAHIGGEPADMDPIMALAAKHDLPVVEDCAQAHGARYKGRPVGTIGDIAAFSTMYGKHHCTGGQGGVVYTTDETLFWEAKRFADRGKPINIDGETMNIRAGLNCNSNELSAAIGLVQLKKLPGIIERRQNIGETIKAEVARTCKAISMGWQVEQTEPVYWFMRFKLDLNAIGVDKTTFCKALLAEGIPAGESYRHIPCEMPWFRNKAVLGKSGFPWNSSDYKGPRDPEFDMTNVIRATDEHFMLYTHENYDQDVLDDIIKIFKKVENAYLK